MSPQPRGALLVAGTSSDAGKSLIVAGLCRALHRSGVSVAPFKAQNMSNNSVVTLDGGEIGRAQAMQASACGLAPSVRFNPVLLKPGSDRRSQVVVRGQVDGTVGAADYHARRAALANVVSDELASLRADFDVVICEGAGSPAEINLRRSDIANMGLAALGDLPVIVVGDIDRGGVLAHLLGTLACLGPADQARIAGFVINKFRGDRSILEPGLRQLLELTGRPTIGVVPYADGLWLDAEDSLASVVGTPVGRAAPAVGSARLSVVAIRLPRISNSTDVEALACEPGVDVRWVDDPASVAAADLVVLPGSKATVSDLAWLRSRGIDDVLTERARLGRPILGICGGYQMLGTTIVDDVEARAGTVSGLGILTVTVQFAARKILRQSVGVASGHAVRGYEIHHGRAIGGDDTPLLHDDELGPEGSVAGAVAGTHWHGLLANDDFRRDYLREVARWVGLGGFEVGRVSFEEARMAQLDLIADLVETELDMRFVTDLLSSGVPHGLPVITTSLS
ncbi:cobyric acid synthase CobQ [Williamsia sp. 1138]|uniref:cobyric acid synthase n=1 Tax=Williamsia sp. 1138 TaxID=1903117 RepID=UPI000A1050C1|nr:cobyric acid synthase [Williamsia sp. 1138]OZG26754.1 cobyric acid synthase CobQ [Williamsia sp. 1138]